MRFYGDSSWIALLASGLIGAGFSLIFPALCVEAIASVSARNRASAVSLYTGFIELSLAITTAGAGFPTTKTGFRGAFATAAAFAMVALCATFYLRTFVVHRYREVQKQHSNHA